MAMRKRPCTLGFYRKCGKKNFDCLHCIAKIIKGLETATFEETEIRIQKEKKLNEKIKFLEGQIRTERENRLIVRKKLAEEERKRIKLTVRFSKFVKNLENSSISHEWAENQDARLNELEEILKGTAKFCECECGELIRTYSHGDYRRFKNGHAMRGNNHWNYGGTISKEQVAAMMAGKEKAENAR